MPRDVVHLFVLTPVDHRDRGDVMAAVIMSAEMCAMRRVFATSSDDNDTYQTLYGLGRVLANSEERTRHDCLQDGDIDACVKLAEEADYAVVVLLTHPQFASTLAERCARVLFDNTERLPPVSEGNGWYLTPDAHPQCLVF